MTTKDVIQIFDSKKVRTVWNSENEKWYFSIVDVIAVLTDSPNPPNYWRVLKNRLIKEGNQSITNCNELKLQAADGKFYKTAVADTEQLLRIIQSIPSPKAEPFKLWLAKVGSDRIDEMADPELAITRALEYYAKKGYSLDWINQRLKTIEVRKQLTDEWDKGGIKKGLEYALLTDELYSGWAGLNAREYKKLKGLFKENLRDNMSNMELVLNMLAEVTTTELAKKANPKGFSENMKIAKRGGTAAGRARREIEKETGTPVITSTNAKNLKLLK